MTEAEFEPRIIAFLCNWCTYTGADLAGTSRIQYPPNIRIIRLMCSGGLDPVYVSKALLEGADGYQSGNYKARRRVAILHSILDQMGFDQDRVWLRWVSASEGQYFADTVSEMVAALKEKGPNPLKGVGLI